MMIVRKMMNENMFFDVELLFGKKDDNISLVVMTSFLHALMNFRMSVEIFGDIVNYYQYNVGIALFLFLSMGILLFFQFLEIFTCQVCSFFLTIILIYLLVYKN